MRRGTYVKTEVLINEGLSFRNMSLTPIYIQKNNNDRVFLEAMRGCP
jgi:hypothetical protein